MYKIYNMLWNFNYENLCKPKHDKTYEAIKTTFLFDHCRFYFKIKFYLPEVILWYKFIMHSWFSWKLLYFYYKLLWDAKNIYHSSITSWENFKISKIGFGWID